MTGRTNKRNRQQIKHKTSKRRSRQTTKSKKSKTRRQTTKSKKNSTMRNRKGGAKYSFGGTLAQNQFLDSFFPNESDVVLH